MVLQLRDRIAVAAGRDQAFPQIVGAAQPVREHENLSAGRGDQRRLDAPGFGGGQESGAVGVAAAEAGQGKCRAHRTSLRG
jgi:hypothetical protein